MLTGHKEVVDVLRDPDHFSSDRMGYLENELTPQEREEIVPIFKVLKYWVVFRDPPSHTVLRMLLNKLFTPTAIERYRPMVRKIVQKALDKVVYTGSVFYCHCATYAMAGNKICSRYGAYYSCAPGTSNQPMDK